MSEREKSALPGRVVASSASHYFSHTKAVTAHKVVKTNQQTRRLESVGLRGFDEPLGEKAKGKDLFIAGCA